jgi:hypothetical protein
VYGNISGGSGPGNVSGNVSGQITAPLSGTGLPGAAVVLTPLTLSFPETLLGKTATTQDITISNTGGVAASLTSETVTGDFSISANTCTGSLNPNSGCTLSISFSPTVSGNRTGTLTVIDSAGTQTAQLSGAGESPATDGLAPLNLTFGTQTIGTPSLTQQVTLTNNGDQTLQLIATQVSGDFNTVNGCGTSLIGHSSCAIAVNFVPTQVGAETGTLIVSDALRNQTVALAGTGMAPSGVSATPVSMSFGNYGVGGTSPAQAVTLTNNGGVPLSGLGFAATGDFGIQTGGNTCGATLAAGAQCPINVTFSPSQTGTRSGMLTVTAAGLNAPLKVALSGNGENFTLAVSGPSSAVITSGQTATFSLAVTPLGGSTGTVALGCTGAPQNSTCTVNPGSVTLTGSSTATATVTIVTVQAASSAAIKRRGEGGPAWPRPAGAGLGRAGLEKALLGRTGLALAMLAPMGLLAGRRRKWRSVVLLGLLAVLLPVGCGLGVTPGKVTSNPNSPGGPGNSTPSGTYTLTVTGSAPGLSQTVTLTLTVE